MEEQIGHKPRFGIDFGGVLVQHVREQPREDTTLTGIERTEVLAPGAFEALAEMVAICEGQVWIVSKAGYRMRAHTLAWLDAVDFYARTGFEAEHIRFCFERQEKASICQELGINHFVDDRLHVLQILRYTVPHLYLFKLAGVRRGCPRWATFVSGWPELLGAFKAARA